MYTINGSPVTFNITAFEALCQEENITWWRSSLNSLRKLLQRKVPATSAEIEVEIGKIPVDKRKKYKDALRYVTFCWPNMIDAASLNVVADGKLSDRMTFKEYYGTMDPATDFVDLQYGISDARKLPPYMLDAGRVRFADDFNNSSHLGTGLAFGRQWNGTGVLGATRSDVRSMFRKGNTGERQNLGIGADTRQIYANSMLGSRYSPELSLAASSKTVRLDAHKSLAQMRKQHAKDADKHHLLHAQFVKSVRRACKGGIAMVASHPAYVTVEAKVHFVLDGLGDLGAMARKDTLDNERTYVAITSSELAFCCRYWDDPEFPLSDVVKFYVNGNRVQPPWEADYTLADASGKDVYSNQEAWLRYRLFRKHLSSHKPFPKMTGSTDLDEFTD
ncbi:hypothetical protein [Xylophilus sp.]|uniref:hypothetical protein n=1 Tax=Xylophilus sp. TaxID=2653893 RepID=UPI0013BDC5F8|nr:hypothetical protein [Xylophilus sp.]KAF1046715.1 MAG: hypothetical protein GAK38_02278 [Xylophilus sp.]